MCALREQTVHHVQLLLYCGTLHVLNERKARNILLHIFFFYLTRSQELCRLVKTKTNKNIERTLFL